MSTDGAPKASTTTAAAPSEATEPAPNARKVYVAPRLRHLGSVRDLTLGSSNKTGEFGMMNM